MPAVAVNRPVPRRRLRTTALFALIASITLIFASSLQAQTVATYSFEDGTADGWTSFYGASTPTATNAAAYSGSYSLLTSTSSTGTGGPIINLSTIIQPGAKYTITGYVELAAGQSATNANFSMLRSDPTCSGGTCYDTIGTYQVPVTSSGWVQIGGAYTASTTETAVSLYAQLVGATTAVPFYLDEVVITQTAPPPGGTPVASYNFSDGELDGWAPFGPVSLTNTAPPVLDPNNDARALLVSGRQARYMGPSLNLLGINNIVAGATYQVTAYVLLAAPDSSNPTATLATKTTDCAEPSGGFTNLATSSALSSTAWTKVQGTLSFGSVPATPTGLTLYISSSSPTDSFYIDNVSISQLAPAPLSPSQQDNSGITSTFEDGGLDGWSSRTGSSTVANSTATAHGGTHSLLTTGRVANYDGPQISVSDKMYVGSVYNMSVWVKLLPTDNSSHIINMSLQTTSQGNTSYPSVTGYPGVTVLADGNWHQISVSNYTMSSPYDPGSASLYLQTVPASGNDLVSFYIDDFQLTYVTPPMVDTSVPSIYQSLADYFPIGAAIDPTDISGVHAQLLSRNFKSMTSGNDMKWSSVEPTLGTYTFGTADEEVGFAECHNMLVRGHNLVWATGAQTPEYAIGDGTNSPANQATVKANIVEHIKAEVQHFGNKVYVWDVVNEPLDPSQPDCLAHGPFYQVLGREYIDIALKAARAYAPKGTKLFINDYNTTDQNKLACLGRLVQELRDRGTPIDGVGHESHESINYPNPGALTAAVDYMAKRFPDLEQQVTEFDISVYNGGDDTSNYGNDIPESVLSEQGWLYEQYFKELRALKGKIRAVTIWGMADDDTWLDSFPVTRTDYPLPFDMQLQPKPAYWGIVEPSYLPGAGLAFSIASSGTGATQTWTVTATNGAQGPAYATNITALKLTQRSGTACTPVVTPPNAYPISLGDIATSGTATAVFNVDFSSCTTGSTFLLELPWVSSTYHTGALVQGITY
jgi:endo-1,4-beta-xylanase